MRKLLACLLQNVTEAASEEAACNLEGNVTDCCERGVQAGCCCRMCLLRQSAFLPPPMPAAPACLHPGCPARCPAGCTYAAVERVNRDTVKPLIDELVKTPFFRYFKARPGVSHGHWGALGTAWVAAICATSEQPPCTAVLLAAEGCACSFPAQLARPQRVAGCTARRQACTAAPRQLTSLPPDPHAQPCTALDCCPWPWRRFYCPVTHTC